MPTYDRITIILRSRNFFSSSPLALTLTYDTLFQLAMPETPTPFQTPLLSSPRLDQATIRTIFARLFQVSHVMSHLISSEVNAAVGGSLALFLHGVHRKQAPSDMDILIWDEDPLNLKRLLVSKYPEIYTLNGFTLTYTDTLEISGLQFLSVSQSSTLTWLRSLNFSRDTEVILGINVLPLEGCLLGKLSATNTRLRTRIPSRREKGEEDYVDTVSIVRKMGALNKVLTKVLTPGARNCLELFSDEDRALFETVFLVPHVADTHEVFETRVAP
ncbi:hypothetical protein L873DRAFT_1480481 [Choiromyces venosus 120613-1]|uniref:Uncharacterized protein n=1 Tax=Choiromyces venosus 120613-1 TaxID=1336337 RepID=A0A3N4J9U1_9PEZI|nr:hypothetical protein L873DRAFT_1480481 [Choiromyces venosus 120613-1]